MNTKTTLPVLLVVLAMLGWVFWPQLSSLFWVETPQEPEMVACTMDAMQCPDGRWVGRTGPNCEFSC